MAIALSLFAAVIAVAIVAVKAIDKHFPGSMAKIASNFVVYATKDLSARDVKRSSQAYTGNVAWVYFLLKNGDIVYVGQTSNLRRRLAFHAQHKDFDSYSVLWCDDRYVDILEAHYIQKFNPILNSQPGSYRQWRRVSGREIDISQPSIIECCSVGQMVYVNQSEWEKLQ